MSTLASDLVIRVGKQTGGAGQSGNRHQRRRREHRGSHVHGKRPHTAELHILVPHSEPVYRALANTHGPSVTREREVVVVQAQDRPGELAELATRVSEAGVNLDLVYVATNSRVVLGSENIETLKETLDGFSL